MSAVLAYLILAALWLTMTALLLGRGRSRKGARRD